VCGDYFYAHGGRMSTTLSGTPGRFPVINRRGVGFVDGFNQNETATP
jgi:hypothetical protein